MKTSTRIGLVTLLAVGLYGRAALGQAPGGPGSEGRDRQGLAGSPPPPPGPGRPGHPPPPPLVVLALDVNGDGIIDATEIKHAVAALRSLDKNGDGKLTPDEYMGPMPGHRMGGRPPQGPPGRSGEGDERHPGVEARGGMFPGGPDASGNWESGRPERMHGPENDSALGDPDRAPRHRGNEGGNLPSTRPQPGQDGPGMTPGRLSPKELMDKYDTDGDGKLDAAELGALLKDMARHEGAPKTHPGRPAAGASPEMAPPQPGPHAPGE
jgi:hypothetical protein